MITQARLKEVLDYNSSTGIFIRNVANSNRVKAGQIAGCRNSVGYRQIYIDSKVYLSHRLAWLYIHGEFPDRHIDHINHIKDDNRIENLREVTNQENLKNQSISKRNTTGVTGVYWCKTRKKWYTHIKIDGRIIYLGYFIDKFEAICSRKSAENKNNYHPNHGS